LEKVYLLPEKVKNDPLLPFGAKIFYTVLTDIIGKSRVLETPIEDLAKKERVTGNTVRSWIKHLAECGYLNVDTISTGHGREYRLKITLLPIEH